LAFQGWNLDCVSGFEPLHIATNAVEQEVVKVDLLNELFTSIVKDNPQRTF
jgi:hypothetical protein